MLWLIFVFLTMVSGIVKIASDDFAFLQSHPMRIREYLTNSDLSTIVYEEWDGLRATCPLISDNPSINIQFDGTLAGGSVLAWASQTLVLDVDFLWKPSLIKSFYSGYDIEIGINPDIPNGWHSSKTCENIGYRYDLRSVLRHELVHGMSMASSVSHDGISWSVGHFFSGTCYPRFYDTKIMNEQNESVVDGCTVAQDLIGKDIYLNGVKLYNPIPYAPGSSISHHDHPGNLMYYSVSPTTCMTLGNYEVQMLAGLEIYCSLNSTMTPSLPSSSGTVSTHLGAVAFLPFLLSAVLLISSC